MSRRVHIVGAGLSGLSAALRLAGQGIATTVYEAGAQAGGRCRSYVDPVLNRSLDNGAHLVLGANREVFDYLRLCKAEHTLRPLPQKGIPFYDLTDAKRWTLRVGVGAAPSWIFDKRLRGAGIGLAGVVGDLYRLHRAGGTVSQALNTDSTLFRRFWHPLCVAILNCAPERGAASLLRTVLERTMLKGPGASRLYLPEQGLSSTFIDPALAALERLGTPVHYHARLRAIDIGPGGVSALHMRRATVLLSAQERVIFAVPPHVLKGLVAGIPTPESSNAIINIHFDTPAHGDGPGVSAVVGGMGEWVFSRGQTTTVTLSNAQMWMDMDDGALAGRVWKNISCALDIDDPMGAYRIIREKRATFLQSPENERRRPGVTTALENLFLAGDWTDTTLPATIEGAILSGRLASEAVLRSFNRK